MDCVITYVKALISFIPDLFNLIFIQNLDYCQTFFVYTLVLIVILNSIEIETIDILNGNHQKSTSNMWHTN